ncbi:response regulator transcription factor [Quadrisphaera sp. KR29]|uniref:response regulator transcription factor n=1 Tax=Quadrisphaera sp. KR29 TaxID=3461391 RepID=UPI004044AAD6
MSGLASGDLLQVLEVAGLLAAVDTWEDFQSAAMPALAALVGADGVVHHDVDLALPRELNVVWPADAFPLSRLDGYAAEMPDHPFIQQLHHLHTHPVLRITDLQSQATWQRSRVYRESLRGLGADDQLACLLTAAGSVRRAVSCFRVGAPFTDRERDRLAAVRPFLVAAAGRLQRRGGWHLALQAVPTPRWVVVADAVVDVPPLLTAREQEVMALLAAGRTCGQAARLLGCSPRTVSKHVEHIHAKLGASTRLEALARWRDRAPGGATTTTASPVAAVGAVSP